MASRQHLSKNTHLVIHLDKKNAVHYIHKIIIWKFLCIQEAPLPSSNVTEERSRGTVFFMVTCRHLKFIRFFVKFVKFILESFFRIDLKLRIEEIMNFQKTIEVGMNNFISICNTNLWT